MYPPIADKPPPKNPPKNTPSVPKMVVNIAEISILLVLFFVFKASFKFLTAYLVYSFDFSKLLQTKSSFSESSCIIYAIAVYNCAKF